jgi:hypothetical protein
MDTPSSLLAEHLAGGAPLDRAAESAQRQKRERDGNQSDGKRFDSRGHGSFSLWMMSATL